MSRWSDAAAWARLRSEAGCPICRDGGPTDVVAGLEASVLAMGEAAPPLPGTCAVILRRHAVELHELPADEAAALMRDLQRVSRAVQAATGAVKVNLELHGNTIPHLHVHVYPRYVGDPFEHGPIDPRRAPADEGWARARHLEARRGVIAALAAEGAGTPAAPPAPAGTRARGAPPEPQHRPDPDADPHRIAADLLIPPPA